MTVSATATAEVLLPVEEPAIDQVRAIRDSRPLRLITCGSVDDGKSTLIGRLLWDTKAVKEDQAATLFRQAERPRPARFRPAARRPPGRARTGHHH
jgi:sulfate adenylyltransferase subunit 1